MDGKDVFVKFLAKIHYITRWFESLQGSKLEPRVVDDQVPEPNGLVEVTSSSPRDDNPILEQNLGMKREEDQTKGVKEV